MKQLSLVAAICAVALAELVSTASAAPVKLIYTGNAFTSLFFQPGSTLPADVYTTADSVTGSIDLLEPLGPNLTGVFVNPVSFVFSDGVNTITNADATSASFQFWTDSSGQIVNWAVNVFDISPGVFRQTVQTLNLPGAAGIDGGSSYRCLPELPCVDASGSLISEPFLFVQSGRNDGSPGTWTAVNTVPFSFRGFFSPVANDPAVNRVKAGAGVPVKFSLGGDRGLDIFQLGFPESQPVACDSFAILASVESTVSARQSELTYEAAADQYTYVWKTNKSWAGTCQQLVLRLADGSFHIANFQFDR